ncbi:MAG: DNA translocase FtsK [Alphaproteobacteria bacterium]
MTTTVGSGSILPSGTTEFLRRRLSEGVGVVLCAAAAFLLISLFSYSPGDPSLNSAAGDATRNLLGLPGSITADLFLQTIGLAGLLPAVVLGVWGAQILRKRPPRYVWLRLCLMLVCLMLLSLSLSVLAVPADWPLATRLGGVAGAILLERSVDLVSGAVLSLGLGWRVEAWMVALAAAVPGIAALVTVLGLSLTEWRQIGRWIGHISGRARDTALLAINSVLGFLNRFAPALPERVGPSAEKAARPPKPRAAKRSATTKVAAKSPKPKAGRKAVARRQQSLDLVPGEEFDLPPHDLLEAPPAVKGTGKLNKDSLQQNARLLETVLDDFGVRGEITKVRPGPVVTLYELEPAPGTKTSRVIGLSDDIARSMSAVSVRVAVVPGRNVIGIELPNLDREMVYLRELLGSDAFERSTGKLNLALGKDIGGLPVTVDLARMPHLLIAGTTGSGKSVGINTMILSLLYQLSPDTCKFIMIDPKMLELSVYEGIPHLITPVVTEPAKAVMALKWAVREMEDRYRAMSQLGVRNIAGYNSRLADAVKRGEQLTRRVQTGFDDSGKPVMEEQPLSMEPLPFIVVVVDEMADLMLVAGKDIEAAVQRLAQMARAAGIHMIMATQRPSVDVITGTIKANFPTRISFQVTSKIDSRTILGEQGAEQLLGQGDMLYMAGGGRVTRVHGPFVSDEEVEHVVSHLKSQGAPCYLDEVTEDVEDSAPLSGGSGRQTGDELYDEAVALIAREGKASTSFIQRHLQIGYNRAARIIEQMESEGVVSKANRVGRREVLIGNVGETVL